MRLSALLIGSKVSTPFQDVEIQGISYDTRSLRPGELFVALRGYKTDGHRYIDEAMKKGAAAVVAEAGENCILVPDSRAALAKISANWFGHPARALTVVGVTGTNGKTTTTSLLKAVIEETLHTKAGLLGTIRNMIGPEEYPAQRTTPESYEVQQWLRRMVDAGCTHAVLEVSSHALALHRVDGIRFAAAAFTNLTREHLDFHQTMEAYREAKGRLFTQCDTAVLNLDDESGRHYLDCSACKTVTYSETKDEADLTAKNLRVFPNRVEFEAVTRDAITRVRLGIPGGFSVYNALCTLACADVLGIGLRQAAAALSHAPGVKGRVEPVDHAGPGTVLIDYAHTPNALENVLSALRDFTPGRLICLFGCGGDRDRGKRAVMGSIAASMADYVVITSDNPRTEEPAAIISDILKGLEGFSTPRLVEPDRETAIGLALNLLKEGDTLVLAGKGHETTQEIRGELFPMDEREIVARWTGQGLAR